MPDRGTIDVAGAQNATVILTNGCLFSYLTALVSRRRNTSPNWSSIISVRCGLQPYASHEGQLTNKRDEQVIDSFCCLMTGSCGKASPEGPLGKDMGLAKMRRRAFFPPYFSPRFFSSLFSFQFFHLFMRTYWAGETVSTKAELISYFVCQAHLK